jgi:hypothetical protein
MNRTKLHLSGIAFNVPPVTDRFITGGNCQVLLCHRIAHIREGSIRHYVFAEGK